MMMESKFVDVTKLISSSWDFHFFLTLIVKYKRYSLSTVNESTKHGTNENLHHHLQNWQMSFLLFLRGIMQELEEYFLHYLDNGEENKFLAAMILKLSQ